MAGKKGNGRGSGKGNAAASAAERAEKVRQRVSEARREAVDTILEMMEDKGLAWVCEWDRSAFLPLNGASERRYNGGNRIHLAMQAHRMGYDDPRWFTFKQAEKLGYHVAKGEKSSIVEYWKRRSFMVDSDGEVTYDPDDMDRIVSYPRLVSYFSVFNAEQLRDADGKAIPMPERKLLEVPDGDWELADNVIKSSRCPVHEERFIAQACYKPTMDIVEMPSRLGFKSVEGFLTTLTHEMAHSTMKPLERKEAYGNSFGSEGYAFEELIAELSSTFTCIELGVHRTAELEGDENFANHAAYLRSWMKAMKDDPDVLFKAAGKAEAATDYLVEGYKKAMGPSVDGKGHGLEETRGTPETQRAQEGPAPVAMGTGKAPEKAAAAAMDARNPIERARAAMAHGAKAPQPMQGRQANPSHRR